MKEFIEKLIARLEDNHRTIVTNDEDLEWNRAVYSCTEIIKELAEEYKGGWIPCSERLPEEDVEVLVCIKDCEGNHYYDLTYFHIVWQTEIGGMYSSVIAWQPLPASYKPKGE